MEPAPIYQGQAFATPRLANASSNMPTKPLFADLWEQNRSEATKALQGIEQALIDRNDNTVLLFQQAEAKANDIALTTELKDRLSLPNGAPNGFYDANGKIIPSAVREIVTRYRNLTHSWNKALIDPTNQQRSAESTVAYQQGINSATEAAILANTHKREATAYMENIAGARRMNAFDDARALVYEGNEVGALPNEQAGRLLTDIDRDELTTEISGMSTAVDMARAWDNPYFRERLSYYPEVEEQFTRALNRQSLTGTPARVTATRNADGTTSTRRTPATPPPNAPYYLEQHWNRWNGTFNSPEAKTASIPVMQRWLSENITRLKGSPEGDAQWSMGLHLAKQLGLENSEYEQLYRTRSGQISYGGFDARAVIENIPTNTWLGITLQDEAALSLAGNISQEDKEKLLGRIANETRAEVLRRYTLWWSANEEYKPQPREQAARLQAIINEVKQQRTATQTYGINSGIEQSQPDTMRETFNRITHETQNQEEQIRREIDETHARRRRSESEGSWRRLMGRTSGVSISSALQSPFSTRLINAANMADMNTFSFELGLGAEASDLPDTDTKSVIYVPRGANIPERNMRVLANNGRQHIDIELRPADVERPVMSRMLRLATGTITRNPAAVHWDGVNLTFSDNEAESSQETEEAIPVSNSLLPDDGINEEDAEAFERWQGEVNELGELPFN